MIRKMKQWGNETIDTVVLVDRDDNELGVVEKEEAHRNGGSLHRAISVWIVNSKAEVLITRRSKKKMLWPDYWSNTICSHPQMSESFKAAGERRLMEELGFSCDLEFLFKFVYGARYRNVGWERELTGVLIGRYDPPSYKTREGCGGEVIPNKDEVSDFKWVDWKELERWSEREREIFTPWFFMEKKRLEKMGSFKKLVKI